MVKDFRATHKKIYDPVHGFIRFDEDEKALIDSYPFQRLHYIRQLGATYMVYPGATHTRFEHSLGVMDLSTKIYSQLCKNIRPDLFDFIPRSGSSDYIYWKKVLRIASLCHDLGHLPFSHVAEKQILGEKGHEYWTLEIIKSKHLKKVWDKITNKALFRSSEAGRSFVTDVIKIALGEKVLKKIDPHTKYRFSTWEKILSEIINGEFFGTDRIDYLLRDSKFTGVVYGLFDYLQLIESLRILPKEDMHESLVLGIDINGIESCEALVLARHFMHRRVYQYPSVKAYNFHIRRFIKDCLYDRSSDLLVDVDTYLASNDSFVISELHTAALDKNHKFHIEAKRFLYRKDKFKAIAFSGKISENQLISFKNEENISDDEIAWDIFFDNEDKGEISFPVVKNYFTITTASEFSKILSTMSTYMPINEKTWIYIAPKHEMSLMKFLENCNAKKNKKN